MLTVSFLPVKISLCKMDIRVASIFVIMVALTAAHGDRYVVKKLMKAAPQYKPYSVKSHGMKTEPQQCVFVRVRLVGSSLSLLPLNPEFLLERQE